MALHHAAPGEVVDVRPLKEELRDAINVTLLRSEHLQVFRVVLSKGEEFSDHAVPGEITVQYRHSSQSRQGGSVEEMLKGALGHLDAAA